MRRMKEKRRGKNVKSGKRRKVNQKMDGKES